MLYIWKYLRGLLLRLRDKHSLQELSAPDISTLVNTDFQLSGCKEHRFGLPANRWEWFAGKAFWITGGGTGYGRALATVLNAAGARVFISGRRQGKLEETITLIQENGFSAQDVHAVTMDVTDPESVNSAAKVILASTPIISGLVHCAALPEPPCGPFPLMDADPHQWAALMNTNITGGWLVTRSVIGHMAEAGIARVLFFTSTAGWNFTAGVGPYNISKAAVNNLGGSLAEEASCRFPDTDIQINMLDPGESRTEMNQGSDASTYCIIPMALLLLSNPLGGPNGKFFVRDGRHLSCASTLPWPKSLLATPET